MQRPSDTGISLVEVMVAMGVFVIGSLSLLSVLTSNLSGTFDNRARLTAANLVASDIDEARSLDYYSLSPTDYTRVVDGRQYRIVREVTVTMSSPGGTTSCAGSGSARQLHKRVSTRVTTAFQGSTRPVRADTLVKAPLFDPNSALGALSILVIDRNGSPLPGLTVASGSVSRVTDSNGCAFFEAVTPGTVTATVTKAGWVTIAGSSSLSRSVAVSAGQISSETLRIGPAVPISLTGNVFSGNTVVSGFWWPTGLTARLAAPDRATPTRVDYAAQALSPGVPSTWSAYPSPGGYDAYTGGCSPPVHTDSEPNTTPQVTLPLSPVTVYLTVPGSQDVKARSAAVDVDWAAALDCEPLRYGARTASNCSPNSGSASSACVVHLAVPPGTWRFNVPSATGSTTLTVAPRTAATTTISVS